MSLSPIKIVIIDDLEIYLLGMLNLFQQNPQFKVIEHLKSSAAFVREGRRLEADVNKTDKYQQVEIEYKNYLSHKGSLWQRFILPLSKVWWNYGYSLERIVYWTLGFLLGFYALNIWQWKNLQAAYPTDFTQIDPLLYYNKPKRYQLRRLTAIFLYTCYIFFSLIVKLDKIHFQSTRILFLFFAEYTVGLICLFFIANALFKL